jgi:hypothetical protein
MNDNAAMPLPMAAIARCASSESEWAFIPTISELIDACGDGRSRWSKPELGWRVSASGKDRMLFAEDPTTAIGTARLWLVVNKSK